MSLFLQPHKRPSWRSWTRITTNTTRWRRLYLQELWIKLFTWLSKPRQHRRSSASTPSRQPIVTSFNDPTHSTAPTQSSAPNHSGDWQRRSRERTLRHPLWDRILLSKKRLKPWNKKSIYRSQSTITPQQSCSLDLQLGHQHSHPCLFGGYQVPPWFLSHGRSRNSPHHLHQHPPLLYQHPPLLQRPRPLYHYSHLYQLALPPATHSHRHRHRQQQRLTHPRAPPGSRLNQPIHSQWRFKIQMMWSTKWATCVLGLQIAEVEEDDQDTETQPFQPDQMLDRSLLARTARRS